MLRAAPALLVLSALLAAGCTKPPPAERAAACQATNWRDYGYNDGLLGVPSADRTNQFADCAELGHPADTVTYNTARADGLTQYCTVENGYQVGYSGRRFQGVCPAHLAQAFVQGFERGRKERPVQVYPSIGFGIGFGHFGYGHRHYGGHHPRRYKDHE